MTEPSRAEAPDVARAAEIAALGLGERQGDEAGAAIDERATAALLDESPRVRAAAIGALVHAGSDAAAAAAWRSAIEDSSPTVRRRAAELAPALLESDAAEPELVTELIARLGDDDTTVLEAAAYTLGELGIVAIDGGAVDALAATVTTHADALAREAAVAALGALGDPAALPAVLTACGDKATVRRRAVLALAPFEGPDVDAALTAALEDRDWQVRQAAEDLTSSS